MACYSFSPHGGEKLPEGLMRALLLLQPLILRCYVTLSLSSLAG